MTIQNGLGSPFYVLFFASARNVSEPKEPASNPADNPPPNETPTPAETAVPAETPATEKRTLIPLKKAKGAWTAIGVLTVVGIICFAFRLSVRGRHGGVPQGDTVWKLTCAVNFDAKKEGVVVRVAIPNDTQHIRVFGQDFNTPGLRQERFRGKGGFRRDAVAVAFRTGKTHAEMEFDLHMSPRPGWRTNGNGGLLPPEDRARFLKPEESIQSNHAVVLATLRPLKEQAKGKDQSKLVDLIFKYCTDKIAFDAESDNEDAVETLDDREGGKVGRSRAMVALCRAARIPARTVAGFILQEGEAAEPHVWCEVRLNKAWQPFDLEFGHERKLPTNYFPMRRGGINIVRVGEPGKDDAEDVDITYTLARRPVPRGMLGGGKRSFAEVLDLTRLPLVTQLSLATLLLLPFGALLTTGFRNVVGVRTFGTFSPTLLALAAIYAEWKTVAMIFALVIAIGVGGRAMLPGFKLMQVPRLSIVFTLVAVSMMLAVSMLDYFGLNPTGHIALLPMVVLTSLVDRIYTVSDEDGMPVAAVRLFWTTIVGVMCFLMFLHKQLGQFVLEFPEVHFFTVALMLLFGLYAGKKLTDLPFFEILGEPESEKEKRKKAEAEAAVAATPEASPASDGQPGEPQPPAAPQPSSATTAQNGNDQSQGTPAVTDEQPVASKTV